jgi:hypothetical protein
MVFVGFTFLPRNGSLQRLFGVWFHAGAHEVKDGAFVVLVGRDNVWDAVSSRAAALLFAMGG